jgi:adenylyl-sulfate kinase
VPRGATVWLTGLPAAGKTTIGDAVAAALDADGYATHRLDGDVLRRTLSSDLGFDAASRQENIRRTAHVSRILAEAGLLVVASLISPYRASRQHAREIHAARRLPFIEVYLDTPLAECERRDPRGLYVRARRGEITGFTGIDDPYEPPQSAEITLRTETQSVAEASGVVLEKVRELDLSLVLRRPATHPS